MRGNVSLAREDSSPATSDVGRETAHGGEIFNDYENNKAYSLHASAKGTGTVAGGKCFKVLGAIGVEGQQGIYPLDSIEGLEKGMRYSVQGKGGAFNRGEIITVNPTDSEITVNNYYDLPLYTEAEIAESKADSEYPDYVVGNYLTIVGRPDLGTTSIGLGASSSGWGSIAHEKASRAEGRGTVTVGAYGHAEGLRTMAGHAGHSEGKDSKALGDASHAEGMENIASGAYGSHAEGYRNEASGIGSHSEGRDTHARGKFAHTEGYLSEADGLYAHAESYDTRATGDGSHAEGSLSKALAEASHAEGKGCTAQGTFSHAEGTGTLAAGNDGSHAEGYRCQANGAGSHAEGSRTKSIGVASHTEGQLTSAEGKYAHAEGHGTFAGGHDGAHAEGYMTVANGAGSHAENAQTQALGIESHAEGVGTIAGGRRQHVQGRFNIRDGADPDNEGKYAHIVGNGTSDTARSNAHTLDWSGNAWYAGSVECTHIILKSPNGTRFKVTVSDSGTLSATRV